ncbi:CCA tRNA nucleotidyltransferase [Clostridium sp.]|uniref:CCA tRNA nucleotidyltransferase n=1 Tax=Clostridium sp. TaxID=1506 RepID=UPI003217BE2F
MYIKIPSNIEKCISMLVSNGYKGYVVGGCVRDCILGRKPNDWDVCTSANPKEIKYVFKDYKTIDTGIKHGTITVIINKEFIEITTFRIDGEYSDNRRPDKVTFTNDIRNDLSRRDFTINAMAYNYKDGIIDYFNGKEDINRKIIRCVGNPEKRFQEDALRIMRALRFMAQLNYSLDKETLKAIEITKDLISNVSVERISVEFNKLILSDVPDHGIRMILDLNIFSLILPEFKSYISNKNMSEGFIDIYIQVIRLCPKNLAVRLTVFLHYSINNYKYLQDSKQDIDTKSGDKYKNDIAENILKNLKYDNNTIKHVKILMKHYNAIITNEKKSVKKLLKVMGEDLFRQLLSIKNAERMVCNSSKSNGNIETKDDIQLLLNEIVDKRECYNKKDLMITGNDLIVLGIKQGKVIGEILDMLVDEVIEKPELNSKRELEIYAKTFYNEIKAKLI